MLTKAEIERIERPLPVVAPSLRDLIAVPFRRRRLTLACLVGCVLLAIVAAIVLPHYQAVAKILLKRTRVDPVLSPSPEMTNAVASQPIVTDEDMRSEIELMNSSDVLSKVVRDLHMADAGTPSLWDRLTGKEVPTESDRVAAATIKMRNDLSISPAKGSYVIDIMYRSKDRTQAQAVLKKLLDVYLDKHTSVHRPSGEYEFFNQQAEQYRKGLQEAEDKLKGFSADHGVVAPSMARDLTVQKLAEFRSTLEQTRAAVAETEHRIQDLKAQASSTPERVTTQVRKSDNAQLAQQLKGTLLTLELKRAELLMKFQPTYRPVQEVEKQIADTKAAIQKEATNPLRDETTDLNQTHELLRTERAKAEADLAAYNARLAATKSIVKSYENRAETLDNQNLVQADLLRNLKTQEDNYLLYLRKSEEARITDALDAKRMVNVAVVQQPEVPPVTSHPGWFYGFLTLCVTGIGSLVVLGGSEYFDSVLHTPKQVEAYIDVPVLASLPLQGDGSSYNGDIADSFNPRTNYSGQ